VFQAGGKAPEIRLHRLPDLHRRQSCLWRAPGVPVRLHWLRDCATAAPFTPLRWWRTIRRRPRSLCGMRNLRATCRRNHRASPRARGSGCLAAPGIPARGSRRSARLEYFLQDVRQGLPAKAVRMEDNVVAIDHKAASPLGRSARKCAPRSAQGKFFGTTGLLQTGPGCSRILDYWFATLTGGGQFLCDFSWRHEMKEPILSRTVWPPLFPETLRPARTEHGFSGALPVSAEAVSFNKKMMKVSKTRLAMEVLFP